MALRYTTFLLEIEKAHSLTLGEGMGAGADRRFALTKKGQEGKAGFRLFDFSRGQYPLLTSRNLAHCYSEWLRLKDQILTPEQKQNIIDYHRRQQVRKLATPAQMNYLNRLRTNKGLPALDGQLSKEEASAQSDELKEYKF